MCAFRARFFFVFARPLRSLEASGGPRGGPPVSKALLDQLGDRFGMATRFPAESPPDIDFWSVLGSILEGFGIEFYSFYKKFAERWGAFAIKDRFENLPSASLQKERRFPFHVKSGLSWGGFGAHAASKTPQDTSKNPKTHQNPCKIHTYVGNLENQKNIENTKENQ